MFITLPKYRWKIFALKYFQYMSSGDMFDLAVTTHSDKGCKYNRSGVYCLTGKLCDKANKKPS